MSPELSSLSAPHSVRDLPGVGWALTDKLQSLNIRTCADLQKLSLQTLQRHSGAKSGTSLHQASRGIDDRPLRTEHKRKSVSAEINYGIRFTKVWSHEFKLGCYMVVGTTHVNSIRTILTQTLLAQSHELSVQLWTLPSILKDFRLRYLEEGPLSSPLVAVVGLDKSHVRQSGASRFFRRPSRFQ